MRTIKNPLTFVKGFFWEKFGKELGKTWVMTFLWYLFGIKMTVSALEIMI